MAITINWLAGFDQWENRNLTKRGGAIGFTALMSAPWLTASLFAN